MTFERTHSLFLVRQIMTHPRIWPHISDDACPEPREFRPLDHPGVWYVLVSAGAELLGMFVFAPQNGVCWEVHTCLYPAAWGPRAREAARAMAGWIWANTPCRRIVTNVPACNRLALRFARDAGMEQFGVNPQSWMKHGKLHDLIMLGISREVNTCLPQ